MKRNRKYSTSLKYRLCIRGAFTIGCDAQGEPRLA